MRSLDQKLAAIRAEPQGREFILADAKDADMAFGVRAPGPRGYLARQGTRPARFSPEVWTREEFGYRNLPEFLDIIREIVQQGLVDIMPLARSTTTGYRAGTSPWPKRADGTPVFENMNSAQRLAYDRARLGLCD